MKGPPHQGIVDQNIQSVPQKFKFGGVHSLPWRFQGKNRTSPFERKGNIDEDTVFRTSLLFAH
jgi:hypothetical protein